MIVQRFPPDAIVLKIAVSLSIGLLVGFEREWSNKDVGIRTFALISLLGMASALVAMPLSVAAFFSIIVLIAIVNVRSILVDRSLEITTSAALLVTFVLGVLVGMGHLFTPVASAILMTMLLAWKTEFQRFAGGVKPEEIRGAVLLCLIGFVIYPTLPDRFIDPWQLINPREAWITVIVVAGLGFFNYVLLRLYSTRGLYWSAVLGGLVNSTAAVAELSTSLAGSGLVGMTVIVVLLTVIAMFVRNLVLLAIFAPAAVLTAIGPLSLMGGVVALVLWRSRADGQVKSGQLSLSSPLSLVRVLEFGALFVLIEVLGNVAHRFYGTLGFLGVSAIGGLISSASATVAGANLAARGLISPVTAGGGTVLASMASALINVPLVARQSRDNSYASRLALLTSVQILLGLAVLTVQYLLLRRLGPTR
jgi:uncharacterized membrane protein (DUF4010 family)